jgi:hypothetical protein
MAEKCCNPLKPSCGKEDIAVTIMAGDRMLPICGECWRTLAEIDAEWGEDGFKVRTKAKKRGNLSLRHRGK